MCSLLLMLTILGVASASNMPNSHRGSGTSIVGATNSNDSSPFNGTSPQQSPVGPEGRSLKYLTPGQEFLLSVASFEDTKDSNFQSLPYLMNVLQGGKLEKKEDKVSAFPLRLRNAMKVMTATEKADEGDDGNDMMAKPPGLLAKIAQDPANLLLVAIVPLSILLAAVIPFLVNQFMNKGAGLSSVTTTAGSSRPLEQRQFVENFFPIIEAIANFGTRLNKEFAKDKRGTEKMNIFRSIFQLISSIVSDSWRNKFSSTPVDRLRYSKP